MNILTKSGYKNIEDCTIGEEIVAYEVGTGIEITNHIIKIEKIYPDFFGNGELDIDGNPTYEPFTWYLVNGIYKMFKYQSIWTSPTTVKHAFQLEVGDEFYDDEDGDLVVTSIEEMEPEPFWWRLTISGDHSFISDGVTYHNASRYWRGTTSDNWGLTSNWSSTSGGATGSSVPTSADDVYFDGNGNNPCNTGTATRSVLSITFTSTYTSTFTLNGNSFGALTIYSSATFHPNTTYTSVYLSNISIVALFPNGVDKTITSNGCSSLPFHLSIGNDGRTLTLVGDLYIDGSLLVQNQYINGDDIYVAGGFNSTTACRGTTDIIMVGSGNIETGASLQVFSNNFTINTSGTYTIGTNFRRSGGTTRHTSGTVVTTGSTLSIYAQTGAQWSTQYFYTSGVTWNNVSISLSSTSGTYTVNFEETFNVGGTLTFVVGLNIGIIGGSAGFVVNNLTFSSISSLSRTWQLQAGNTYTINNSFTDTMSTNAIRFGLASTVASSPAYLTLAKGATMDVGFTNFTDIDASRGRKIWVWKPTLSNTTYIYSLTYLSRRRISELSMT